MNGQFDYVAIPDEGMVRMSEAAIRPKEFAPIIGWASTPVKNRRVDGMALLSFSLLHCDLSSIFHKAQGLLEGCILHTNEHGRLIRPKPRTFLQAASYLNQTVYASSLTRRSGGRVFDVSGDYV